MDNQNLYQNLHLKDYFHIIGQRRWIAIIFFLVTVTLVSLGSLIKKPVYRATVTLLIDLESPNVLTTSGAVELGTQNYYTYKEYFQTQKEIITSRNFVQLIFDEFHLAFAPEYISKATPLDAFAKTITVEPVRDTRLLKLHMDNNDPKLAANLANRLAEIYVKQNLYFITQDELTNLLKNEYLKLETKLSEYAKIYKDKHPNMIRIRQEMQEMRQKMEKVKNATLKYDLNVEKVQNDYQHALQGFKANNVRVLDPAQILEKPRSPKILLNVLVAIFIGILGGISLAFFFQYFDDTLQGSIDLKNLVDWPFLGSIPDIDLYGKKRRALISYIKPRHPVSEAYRNIRTGLLFKNPDKPLKNFLITSPGPQEGKSTTACNLGIVLALGDKKVLLVDADLHKPRLDKIFDVKNTVGLSTYLDGKSSFDEVIQSTKVPNLFLVCSGPLPDDSSELFGKSRLEDFVKEAGEKFSLVIFDTPPLPVVPDGMLLIKLLDGVIVVVKKHTTPRRALSQLYKQLSSTNANIIGTIMNRGLLASGKSYNYYYRR